MILELRGVERSERGQASVEFLLTVIFNMFFILGFLEIVLVFLSYNVIADSAKEGVRYAIVHGNLSGSCNGPGAPGITCDATASGVKNMVRRYANHSGQSIASAQVTVSYNPNGGTACSAPGCEVRVTLAHPYRAFFGLGWPTVTVRAAAQGRITY